jgi:cyclopropane fatty-acyl-phospholipid synthase-like methyltransferase
LIADLGCGSGSLVWWLQKSGYENSRGVDASPQQVDLASQLGIQDIALGDVFTFLDNAQGYSILFARDLIEHFDKQSVIDFMDRSMKALNPGGKLIIQVPNAESPYFGRIRYGDYTHELAFTSSSLSQLLRAVGYVDVTSFPCRPVIMGAKSLIRYLTWRAIEPILKSPVYIESGRDCIVTSNIITVARKPCDNLK